MTAVSKAIQSVIERLERFSIPVPHCGCWIWTGFADQCGYGQIKINKKILKAHRASWAAFRGEIPFGKWVLHSCDNPPCINPDHLFLGTPSDNAADMCKKSRQSLGERNGRAVLRAEDIMHIRQSTLRIFEIAKLLNVHPSTIHEVLTGQTWKHL